MKKSDIDNIHAEADQCLKRNDISRALALYTELSEAVPDWAEPWFILGLIHGELGDSRKAQVYLCKAIELDPKYPDAHLNLAHHLLASGDSLRAQEHCEKALSNDPDYPEAWLFQSSLLASIGKLKEAATAITKALALNPTLPNAWVYAAQLYFQLDDHERALHACRQAQQQDAVDATSTNLLGTILLSMQQPIEAQAAFTKALQIEPGDIEALRGLGYSYLMTEKFDTAALHCSRSLELDPDCAANWLLLSRIYSKQLIFDKAAHCAERAIALNPADPAAQTQLANMLQSMGRFDAALTHYNKALLQAPQDIESLSGRAELYEKMGLYNEAIRDLEPALKSPNTPPQALFTYAKIAPHIDETLDAIKQLELMASRLKEGQGQQIYYHLGRLNAHLGEYNQAFNYYSRANKLRLNDYDPHATEQLVDWIIDEYSTQTLSTAPRSGQKTEVPIFVVGMLRSGTTLTEQILASHPLVRGGGELQELPQIAAALAADTDRNLLRPPAISQLNTERLDSAASSYLDRVTKLAEGAERISDKMLYNVFHLGLIALLFPNSRVIHCVRDPMDTCLSNYLQNYGGYRGFATDLAHIGHFYQLFERLMDHWNTTLELPILRVEYESLVADQTVVTKNILDFCGLPWDPACLAFHKNPRLVNTASYHQIHKPMYDTAVSRWRHYEPYLDQLKEALGLD